MVTSVSSPPRALPYLGAMCLPQPAPSPIGAASLSPPPWPGCLLKGTRGQPACLHPSSLSLFLLCLPLVAGP